MKRISQGEHEAIRANLDLARQVAAQVCGRLRCQATRDDVAGESMLALMTALREYDPARCSSRQSCDAWLRRRVRLRLLDRLRTRWSRLNRCPQSIRASSLAEFAGEHSECLSYSDGAEDRADLRDWLAVARGCLNWRDRIMVVLYWFEDWTMAEIAEPFGTCESNVSLRLMAALAEMRTRMGVRQ